jgi:four helix bundle protein
MKCKGLDVWKRSCRLSVEVYKNFRDCTDFGFKDQVTRSSLSIASNIAEGFRISGLGQLIEMGIEADRLMTFGD